MSNGNKVTISSFYCTQCGNEGVPLPRKVGQAREAGHLKNMFCLTCGKETNHVEIRHFGSYTKEDFDLEFETGRFLEDGTRIPIKDLEPCGCTNCKCYINGKCWNSNKSYAKECEAIKRAYIDSVIENYKEAETWENSL